MALTVGTIKRKGVSDKKVRVGRGNASGKGTYATRGLKGQRSRSGGRGGLKLRGFKQTLQRVPKHRGFKSGKIKPVNVTLAQLNEAFAEGSTVTAIKLQKRGLAESIRHGVKIIGSGKLTKKLVISGCSATAGAKAAIEAAGGNIVISN